MANGRCWLQTAIPLGVMPLPAPMFREPVSVPYPRARVSPQVSLVHHTSYPLLLGCFLAVRGMGVLSTLLPMAVDALYTRILDHQYLKTIQLQNAPDQPSTAAPEEAPSPVPSPPMEVGA